jgi:hypothetical protein
MFPRQSLFAEPLSVSWLQCEVWISHVISINAAAEFLQSHISFPEVLATLLKDELSICGRKDSLNKEEPSSWPHNHSQRAKREIRFSRPRYGPFYGAFSHFWGSWMRPMFASASKSRTEKPTSGNFEGKANTGLCTTTSSSLMVTTM